MPIRRLPSRAVERIWGRRALPEWVAPPSASDEPIGEIWFEYDGDAPELLVKYLFTSERLSIQVHPGDAAARALGYPRGKDEAWFVLEATPDAVIGIGLVEKVTREELRAAALDGSIETLLDWRPVKAGDIFYSPAGTVHAIGPGLSLVEIQQNLDLTYRLYDYGRGRELHLKAGLEVADPRPFVHHAGGFEMSAGRQVLASGGAFTLERWRVPAGGRLDPPPNRPVTIVPIADGGMLGGETLRAGGVWVADESAPLSLDQGADLLVAYPGGEAIAALLG